MLIRKSHLIAVLIFAVVICGVLAASIAIPRILGTLRIPVQSEMFASVGLRLEENAITETLTVIDDSTGQVVFQHPIPPAFAVEEIKKEGANYSVKFRKSK